MYVFTGLCSETNNDFPFWVGVSGDGFGVDWVSARERDESERSHGKDMKDVQCPGATCARHSDNGSCVIKGDALCSLNGGLDTTRTRQ